MPITFARLSAKRWMTFELAGLHPVNVIRFSLDDRLDLNTCLSVVIAVDGSSFADNFLTTHDVCECLMR